jgi:hypothetical protein
MIFKWLCCQYFNFLVKAESFHNGRLSFFVFSQNLIIFIKQKKSGIRRKINNQPETTKYRYKMKPISIKIVRTEENLQTIYSRNDGDWSNDINYSRDDLMSSVKGLTSDSVIACLQWVKSGCVLSLKKLDGTAAYLYLPDSVQLNAQDALAICNNALRMVQTLRIEKAVNDIFFDRAYPEADAESFTPRASGEDGECTDACGVLYYKGNEDLANVLIHRNDACLSVYKQVLLAEKNTGLVFPASVIVIKDSGLTSVADEAPDSAENAADKQQSADDQVIASATQTATVDMGTDVSEELELGAAPHVGIDLPQNLRQGNVTLLPPTTDQLEQCGSGTCLYFKDGMSFQSPLIVPFGSVIHLELWRAGYKSVMFKVTVTQTNQHVKLPRFVWQREGPQVISEPIGTTPSMSNDSAVKVILIVGLIILAIFAFYKLAGSSSDSEEPQTEESGTTDETVVDSSGAAYPDDEAAVPADSAAVDSASY